MPYQTGIPYIDTLLSDLQPHWAGTGSFNTPVVVSYSFVESQSDYNSSTSPGIELVNFSAFSTAQREAARDAFNHWASVANITFVEVSDSAGAHGDIRLLNSNDIISEFGATGLTFLPVIGTGEDRQSDDNEVLGDVVLAPAASGMNNYAEFQFGRFVLIHEIGHALGLNHPNDTDSLAVIPDDRNNDRYTIMTTPETSPDPTAYTFAVIRATAPMVYDVAAIQHLYGANYATNSGDNRYIFDTISYSNMEDPDFISISNFIGTVWDGGGTDIFDASRHDESILINLNPGEFSSLGKVPGWSNNTLFNVGMAYDSWIENAVGGRGNDTIYGNILDNNLDGGNGSDIIFGGAGNDTLNYGSQDRVSYHNILHGGTGDDTYTYLPEFLNLYLNDIGTIEIIEVEGEGYDKVITVLDFVLPDNVEHLVFMGDGNRNGTGNASDNTLEGTNSINTLDGLGGNDLLLGRFGNDILLGREGNDTLDGGGGDDYLEGGEGDDVLISGEDVADRNIMITTSWFLREYNKDGILINETRIGPPVDVSSNILPADLLMNHETSDIYVINGTPEDLLTIYYANGSVTHASWEGWTVADNGLAVHDGYIYMSGFSSMGNGIIRYQIDSDSFDFLGALPFGYSYIDLTIGEDGYLYGLRTHNHEVDKYDLNDLSLLETINIYNGPNYLDYTFAVDSSGNIITGTDLGALVFDNSGNLLAANPDLRVTDVDISPEGVVMLTTRVWVPGPPGLEIAGNFVFTDISLNIIDSFSFILPWGEYEAFAAFGNFAAGTDTGVGGNGNDSYFGFNHAGDVIIETVGGGIDTLNSTTSVNLSSDSRYVNIENINLLGSAEITGTGTSGINVIAGNPGNNGLNGLAGDDALYGGDGDDVLDGGAGNDFMSGGLGNDSYYLDSTLDTVDENINEGLDRIYSLINYTLGMNTENLTLLAGAAVNATGNLGNNTITGNQNNNLILGLDGDDSLFGLTGNDNLQGGTGNDLLDGGTGNDTLVGGAGNDTYYIDNPLDNFTEFAGQGIDTVAITYDYTIGEFFENLLLLDTGTGINATGNLADNIITGNLLNNLLNGLYGDDTLMGMGGNDLLQGGRGHDDLRGGDGNDRHEGGYDTNLMAGGTGNDTYVVHRGDGDGIARFGTDEDQVIELSGQGSDTVESHVYAYTLPTNVENLVLLGDYALKGLGNGLNNVLSGNHNDNLLMGGDGNDILFGGGGDDILSGGAGNDLLRGETGIEVLTGGSGQDTFVFNDIGSSDLVVDFTGGVDKIQLSLALFTGTGTIGNLMSAGAFKSGITPVALDADDYILYNNQSGGLYYDPDGNGINGMVHFATLAGAPALSHTDIWIIA